LEVEEFEMLDSSFVEKIAEFAERGLEPTTIAINDNKKIIVIGDKIIQTYTVDEPFGKTHVAEFNSFLDAALFLVPKADTAVVAVQRDKLTLSCDANKPHKYAHVELKYAFTSAYEALKQWEGQPKSVAVVNKLLRTKLHDTFDESLVPIFRQVEFARAGSTTITKGTHRDTMGKSVDNAVRSLAGELPEAIRFTTKLIQNVPCDAVPLLYHVDVNHDAETIGINAIGDIADESLRITIQLLVERLKSELPEALVVAS